MSGTLVGIHQRERLVEVNGYEVDLEPSGHLVFVTYEDRPGMVGTVGGILGAARINIAGMQVSREARGGLALIALRLDSALPPAVLAEIADAHVRHPGPLHRPLTLPTIRPVCPDHPPLPSRRSACCGVTIRLLRCDDPPVPV